jgi:hypothetical protein
MPLQNDTDILAAALVGYEIKLNEIKERMADLHRRFGTPDASAVAGTRFTTGAPSPIIVCG